jgi:RAB protein geranylgeranyltransferase component A
LTLADAEKWAERHAATSDEKSNFTHATISKPAGQEGDKIAPSRSYSLALAPQVVYARSALISSLVSSCTHTQLDFQAVGSWFLVEAPSDDSSAPSKLIRVPGGREDIFQDDTLDLKAKRSLMKLLRFVTTLEENPDAWTEDKDLPLPTFLQQKFGLPPASHAPILALTLSTSPAEKTTVAYAVPRISRHLNSIGLFGPGFGALAPKWGGLAEISQVACRAGAVGGGVYVLGKGVEGVSPAGEDLRVKVTLSGSDQVSTKWLVGQSVDLPAVDAAPATVTDTICRSITVVSALPPAIFPRTSEGGVIPVGAVILIPSGTPDGPPVFILAHSSDSGECPAHQGESR